MAKLINGDCLKELKNLKDNSIDTMITDPPYGLSFMGKKWDYDVPKIEIWKECLRVLKPGGTALIFAGSRTQHRMAINVEDAGFILKDTIMWLYGCLSEDTEILTRNGWERYHKNTNGTIFDVNKEILIYDITNNISKWETPKRWSVYSVNKHTCYRIRSDKTDQIVSKEHRCLVERKGKLVFKQAWELEGMERVPILPRNFFNKKKIYWSLLLKKLYWKNKKLAERYSSFILGKEIRKKETGVERILEKKNDWLKKSSVERWINLSEKKRAIRKSINKICSLLKRVYKYGKKRRICNGTQVKSGKKNWKTFIKNRMCSSYKSQCRGQQDRELDVISKQSRPQKIRKWSGYKTTLATVEKIEYTGTLFCPTVSTGVFVARRNGMVFITGNSGFPKATDISKQLDKTVGVKRNRIEVQKAAKDSVDYGKYSGEIDDNNAITPEAKLWNGWKSHSLKPAYEPILIAVKPNDGTYANNALKWGVSGLNIDGGRIGINGGTKKGNPPKEKSNGIYGDGINGKCDILDINKGRFPSNIILDEEAGRMLDEQSGVLKSGVLKSDCYINDRDNKSIFAGGGKFEHKGYKSDKGGASRFFYCAKASKKERNMGCEDLNDVEKHGHYAQDEWSRNNMGNTPDNKRKPIKNFHPTVKPLSLLKYLCTLTKTPTGGTVLDPFMGSGTTGIACKITGRNFIGIELEPEYFKIAEARINNFKVEEKIKKDKRQLEIPMWNKE